MGYSRFALPEQTLVRTGVERATLVRRTYSLVLTSVVVTIGGVWFALNNQSILEASAAHPFIMMILTFAPLMLAQSTRLATPQRLALVLMFTAIEGVFIAPMIYYYDKMQPGVVGQAGALTLSAFTVLTAYAWFSRRDFSAWGGFLTVGLWVMLGTMLLNMFFHNETASLWLAAVGVMLMSGLLLFDTWRIRNTFGPDDYGPAAITIYLDLLNMFLFVLSLLGGGRRRG